MNSADPYELSIFPLHTALFPGMPLPLHVFEDRCKIMINECIAGNKPFGVALIKSGHEVGSAALPHSIGATARIVSFERLPKGRLTIKTVGQERFSIVKLLEGRPYPAALVRSYPCDDGENPVAKNHAARLRPWVARYMQLLATAADTPFQPEKLPESPLPLAYIAAIILQISAHSKQSLLALPYASDLLRQEHALYRSELALLDAMLKRVPDDSQSYAAN